MKSKIPLRISASMVDQFLRIGQPDFNNWSETFTAEKYIAEVKAGWVPTPIKTFGTAFGAIITEPEKYKQRKVIEIESDGCYPDPNGNAGDYAPTIETVEFYRKFTHLENGVWRFHDFDESQVELGIELMRMYRQEYLAAWEVKREIKFGVVTVVCKCDGLTPKFLIDNKTTSMLTGDHDLFDSSSYEHSYQWRLYLLAFPKAEFFRYHVFEFAPAIDSNYRQFIEHNEFEVFPYDEMRYDCECVIKQMADFIYAHNLESYFQPYLKK